MTSPKKKGRPPLLKDRERPSNEADRRWILELLDGSRERHESAYPDGDTDAFVYFAHLSAARQLTEIFYRRLLKPHRISDSEFRVLSSLRRRDERKTTPLELNRFVQITSAGMTRTLDRLEDAGYIERSPNPDDRRSILVGLTRRGREFADAVTTDLGAQYSEALSTVTRKELRAEINQLRTAVERLANAVIR
jgi:DNA-binding MarR family transcriptional regulator